MSETVALFLTISVSQLVPSNLRSSDSDQMALSLLFNNS